MLEFSMLLANNNRSKAYLQNLVAAGIIPARVLLLREGAAKLPEQTANDKSAGAKAEGKFIRRHAPSGVVFDEKESLETTLAARGITYVTADTLDVNSEEVIAKVAALPGRYVVYSGPGGVLLRPPILSQGKRLIHAHPGKLPAYRGSTTVYYSSLLEGSVSASVIFMEPRIDTGPVLLAKTFPVAGEIDFDYLVDPCVRTAALVECLRNFEACLASAETQSGPGSTFYIIHPVLRHLALLKAGLGGNHG